jgi:phosphatidate cytidylyltransferase
MRLMEKSSLLQRLLSAIIIVPVVGACAWFGHPWMTLLVALALGIGAYEFAHLERVLGHNVAIPIPVIIVVLLALERGFGGGRYQAALLALAVLFITTWYVIHSRRTAPYPTPTESWAITVLISVYLGFLGAHLTAIRSLPNGFAWLVLGVGGMWVGDTGAYLVGSTVGKHKMSPHLSPKKTWEGAAGGLVSALLFCGAFAWATGIGVWHGLAVGAMVGIICPFGDLAISMVKRQCNVKDTGKLIPGHGGMLDRLDTLLFIAPLVYYYASVIYPLFTGP